MASKPILEDNHKSIDNIIDTNFFCLENIKEYINTLPGLIIYNLIKYNSPLPFEKIMAIVEKNYRFLRKSDGSLYSNNIKRGVISILRCSGIFIKKGSENSILYWLIEDKSKELLLNMKKNSKVIRSKLKNKNKKLNKKNGNLYEKFKYIKKKEREKESNENNINGNTNTCSFDDIKDIFNSCNDEFINGVLFCYKLFKPILNKYYIEKKKELYKNK